MPTTATCLPSAIFVGLLVRLFSPAALPSFGTYATEVAADAIALQIRDRLPILFFHYGSV